MIVKKIPTSKTAAAKSKAANVRALVDYIAGPAAGGDGGKVEHRGAVNLLNLDHDGQVAEMVDLAEAAKRAPQPVQHWIMSWKEGEQPSPAQADVAVRLFLDEMGLGHHQAVYALHSDTDNWHLHLAVNRVDPETERVVTVNRGFDIEVAHRAIARIEHAQGWQREANGVYVADSEGQLTRPTPRGHQPRQPVPAALDHEERSGEKSGQRLAMERLAPIMRRAASWKELHAALAAEGARFERKGSGALLWLGDQPVKASTAGRDCSLGALQKRLGDFQPADPQLMHATAVPDRRHRTRPEGISQTKDWTEYSSARELHEREAQQRKAALQARTQEGSRSLAVRHRREREALFRISWKGRGNDLNAHRSLLACRQAREKLELRDEVQRERSRLRARFPSYAAWLADRSPELEEEWRHRERRGAWMEGASFGSPATQDLRDFKAAVAGGAVLYRHSGQSGKTAFADRGKAIDVYDPENRAAVLAALQLSAQKWGTFQVHGGERFKKLCAELAAEHGFKLSNPELQPAIAAARERRQLELSRPRWQSREGAHRIPATADAYRRHLEQVVRRHGAGGRGGHDAPSRRDALIAVSMRAAGLPRPEIEKAIREGASNLRPDEIRDWADYARRATAFAWSVPGRREARDLVPTHERSRGGQEL